MIKNKIICFVLFCSFLGCKEDHIITSVSVPPPALTGNYVVEAEPSSELVLQGRDLDRPLKAMLNDQELTISSKSAEKLTIAFPGTVASGELSLNFEEDTIKRFIKIIDNSFIRKDLDFNYFDEINFLGEQTALLYADGRVLRTSDGGDSWEKIYESYFIKNKNTFHPLDEENIWVLTMGDKDIAFTNDGGKSWSEADALSEEFTIEDIFFIGTAKVGLAARNTTDKKLYIFTKEEGEAGWSQQYVSQHTSRFGARACYSGGDIIYLLYAGNSSLLKSEDAGVTWTETPLSLNLRLYPSRPESVSFIDEKTAWAYHIPGIEGNRVPGIYKSVDGGEEWQLLYEPVLSHYSEIIEAVHFRNEKEGYAVTSEGGYLLTEDGGLHWKLYYLPQTLLKRVPFGQEPVRFAGFSGQSIYFYTEGGFIRKSF